MLRRVPEHARHCYERAANCRDNARRAPDAESRAFWEQQEAHWLTLAESYDLSSRITAFLDAQEDGKRFSPDEEESVQTLVDIFDRVCQALELDLSDETQPRRIARTIIEATLAGESDPDRLVLCGISAGSH